MLDQVSIHLHGASARLASPLPSLNLFYNCSCTQRNQCNQYTCTMQALTAIQKAGPADFMSRPAVLATHLALLEAAEDLQGARSLAQSSLQAADQSKGQSASTKAVLYETLARVQLKVIPCSLCTILAALPHSIYAIYVKPSFLCLWLFV